MMGGLRLRGVPCVAALISGCVLGCLNNERDPQRLSLVQIGEAFVRYQEHNGSYPPSIIKSSAGVALHSWRVLLLPYLEANSVYNRYDFSAAWDAGSNAELLALHSDDPKLRAQEVYCGSEGRMTHAVLLLPSSPSTMTVPQGLHATRTAWTAFQPTVGNDIMVLWCDRTSIPWTEPRDYSAEQLRADAALLNSVQGAIQIAPDKTMRYVDRAQALSVINARD